MKYNYFVSVFAEGKNVNLYYSEDLNDLVTISAMHKGCEICIFDLLEFKQLSKKQVESEIRLSCLLWKKSLRKYDYNEVAEVPLCKELSIPKKSKPRQKWIRPVMCVETGQIFASIRECSDKIGIPYMTIANCINNGNATHGVHFVNAPKVEPIEHFIEHK